MRQLAFLVQVSRPIIWPVLPLIYCFGLRAAHASLSPTAIAQILLLTFPMNLIGCGLNDIYDIDSDRLSERRRKVFGAVVRPQDRKLIAWSCLAMAPLMIAGALVTQNSINVVLTLSLLVIAWAYSVPPLRLKERPPLDSLSNGLGYFLLPFAIGYSLGANPLEMPLKYYLLALAVCGIHALATAADFEADRAAGHRTFAVAFGRRAAATLACLAFAVALALGDYYGAAARTFLSIGAIASLSAALLPNARVIMAACTSIFVGFLLAAICHLFGC